MEQSRMAKASAAQLRASDKYNKANTVNVGFRVNKNTDQDVLEWLEHIDNKRAYLLGLIRKDIAERQEQK